jgi:hypothetical protein
VITSSNEDEFYGPTEDYEMLAAMVGEKYFPTSNCTLNVTSLEDTTNQKGTSKNVTSEGTSSKTPVPQAHKKRVIKPTKMQLSPYVKQGKKSEETITKESIDMYNRICMHGSKAKTHLKGQLIVDYGSYFVHVPDFADSFGPKGWISNSTMEVELHVISKELEAEKKCVMPLIIAVSVTYNRPPHLFNIHVFLTQSQL